MTTAALATVLVVDDEPSSVAVLAGALQKAGYKVLKATGGEQAVRLATDHLPELILLDLMMPGVGGVDVCQILKADESTASIPIIFVTADTDRAMVLDAFSAGGCDYVCKPVRVDEILARVSVHVRLRRAEKDLIQRNVRIEQLAGQLADINSQLAVQAQRDPLTHLMNRRAWREAVEMEHQSAEQPAAGYAIAMLDIDHFKALNDTDGHAAGDECLKRIAASLSRSCRASDLLARYGGEEFIVLAPSTDEASVRELAERIRRELWSLAIPHRASITADRVTVSVGAAIHSHDQTLDEVIERADLALYRAKAAGRNRVVLDTDSVPVEAGGLAEPMQPAPADSPPTVLVVDDDAVSRKLCKGALTRLGYCVKESTDGFAALADARTILPDVIIMDVNMPGINGLECTRRLKADRRTSTIPVIILSACDAASDVEAGLDSGADEYLLKPIRVHDLKARVRSMARVRGEHKSLVRAMAAETARRVLETELAERRRVESELRAAIEEADAANVAKSEFLAVVSHELRTPLHGVIGMTQLLLTTSLDPDQRRFTTIACKAADLLLSVINDVLDYSKIEAGGLELEHVPFDFPEFLNNVASMFVPRAEAKGLDYFWGVHPQSPITLVGDALRLGQVLTNLLANAIKFTSSGSIIVRAVVDEERTDDVILRFTVNDTGVGIPAGCIDRLFAPFSQVDATTTRKYGGTGLGLAICRKLVGLMDGQIGVMSQPGCGSTFWFTVRLDKADQATRPSRPAYADIRSLSLLVVSAENDCRRPILEQLDGTGIRVDEACSEAEGLARLISAAQGRKPYGLALIDANQSQGGVQALVQTIARDPSIRNTPLIIMGRAVDATDTEELHRAGFSGSLMLPSNRANLLDAVAAALACAIGHWSPDETKTNVPTEMPHMTEVTSQYRILVAEDNEIGQEVIRETLRRGGHECDIVPNGEQAISAVRDHAYDLVLMDCMMPRMDGFEATRRIRNYEKQLESDGVQHTPIPIIALTANASPDDRNRCLAAGMNAFLTKPLDLTRLMQVIDSYLITQGASLGVAAEASPVQPTGHTDPEPDADRPPFDVDALESRWGSDREIIDRLMGRFKANLRERLRTIELAVCEQNAAQLRMEAHSLKGEAAYVAAERLHRLAAELESMGQGGDLSRADECIKAMSAEIERCLSHSSARADHVQQETKAS